jgi:hypothetical protein
MKTGLTTISLACLSTSEEDKAVGFYESLGFEKRTVVTAPPLSDKQSLRLFEQRA